MRAPQLPGGAAAALLLLTTALVVVTQPLGLWWMALIAGFALGLLLRGWVVFLGAALAGVAGWGLPLLWESRTAPVGAVAQVLGGLLGLPAAAALLVTLAVPLLLALVGAWMGCAVRRLLAPRRLSGEPTPTTTSDRSAG